MTRIDFEWEVEASAIDQPEDAERSKTGLRRARRALLVLALAAVAFALAGMAATLRVAQSQTEIAQQLRDTIAAEAAALRIGDRAAFLRLQSGDESWLAQQNALFDQIDAWKTAGAIDLTGEALSLRILEDSAHAIVREDRYSVPHARLGFYLRADKAWRRIAPNIKYWGERQRIELEEAALEYRSADDYFARQLAAQLAQWLRAICAAESCPQAPLAVDIAPELEVPFLWRGGDETPRLSLRSPHVFRAQADSPLEPAVTKDLYASIAKNWPLGD